MPTAAIGLDWKNLAVSAGRLDIYYFSSEFSGTVTAVGSSVQKFQPGDRVYGLAPRQFGAHFRLPRRHAQLMPAGGKFEELKVTKDRLFSSRDGTSILALMTATKGRD